MALRGELDNREVAATDNKGPSLSQDLSMLALVKLSFFIKYFS